MDRIAAVERNASAPQDFVDELGITHPARGVERGATVDSARGLVETEAEHQLRCRAAPVENRVCQTRVIRRSERRQDRWILVDESQRPVFVGCSTVLMKRTCAGLRSTSRS